MHMKQMHIAYRPLLPSREKNGSYHTTYVVGMQIKKNRFNIAQDIGTQHPCIIIRLEAPLPVF